MRGDSEAKIRLQRTTGRHILELPVTALIAAEAATNAWKARYRNGMSDKDYDRLKAEETVWQIQRIKEILSGRQ